MLFSPATSIFAFGPNDIWIAAASVHHYDGNTWTQYAGIQGVGNANKIWGSSSSDLWFVGNNGFIAHRSPNGNWQKIESGTTLPILDIWGSKNIQTGETEILAVGSYGSFDVGKKLLSIKNTSVFSLSDSGLPQFGLGGIWFEANRKCYLVAGGLYAKKSAFSTAPWDTLKDITIYSIGAIRGTAINNIIATGTFGTCIHYNGSTWKNYPETMIDGSYVNVDIRNKTAAMCGWVGSKAVVTVGRQN